MTRAVLFLITGLSLFLTGCQTTGNSQIVSQDQNLCPKVTIVDDLRSLSEFINPSAPSGYNMISSAYLDLNETSCIYRGGNVSIDLKLSFQSRLGTRGKLTENDKPFFSYPFFIAVTNPQGNILAKEVFGASMTYERGETSHIYFENLRQVIPIADPIQGQNYELLIGFQLSPQQLEYNRRTLPVRGDSTLDGQSFRPANLSGGV